MPHHIKCDDALVSTIDAVPRKKINPPRIPKTRRISILGGDFYCREFNHLKELIYFFNSSWKSKNNHAIAFLDD